MRSAALFPMRIICKQNVGTDAGIWDIRGKRLVARPGKVGLWSTVRGPAHDRLRKD
jgi:hypothetical protein